MFIGRKKELSILSEQFANDSRTAVLVYGKRRVGKSTLIAKAAEDFDGCVISHLCTQSTFEGNLELLARSVCLALDIPIMRFDHLYDLFDFLKAQHKRILLVIDEYQYLKRSCKGNEVDSLMQAIIDSLPPEVKIVLCGSFITVMRELLEEENPLFGRFTSVIHLEEFDYYDAARFCPELSPYDKAAFYAVFGGSPYVLSTLDFDKTLAENVIDKLLPETSVLRIHVESVMLREIQRAFDVRILQALSNRKLRYSEIKSTLNLADDKGLLDKQLKNLAAMETVRKVAPINKQSDKRKQFYELNDNLMRFYFAYVFGNSALLGKFGEASFYANKVEGSITQFVSRRFEEIVRQYFKREAHAGRLNGVSDFGTYWYDDASARANGEYDCVLARDEAFDFYECKYYDHPMTIIECQAEAEQARNAPGITVGKIGFACIGGFDFNAADSGFDLISGDTLYR